jgi:tRNA 2-thiocytidine biosynthesis protein TtcA
MANISLSQLSDRSLFDFESLTASGIPLTAVESESQYSPMATTTVNTWEPDRRSVTEDANFEVQR